MARDNAALHILSGGDASAPSRVAISAAAFSIAAANPQRTNLSLYYEESGTPGTYVSVLLGAGVTATVYTFRMFPAQIISFRAIGLHGFRGAVSGLGDAATGFLQVQEFQ